MTERELRAWLTLYFTPRIGPKTFERLLKVAEPHEIVSSSSDEMRAFGLSEHQVEYIQRRAEKEVDGCLAWREREADHHIVTRDASDYPPLLANAPASPAVLFVKGKLEAIHLPQLAMVGSRNASQDGLSLAREFASALVKEGLCITSGLALGIDGYAHDGALKAGGETVAVLGSGLGEVYPARHRALAERITQQGALVSELHPQAKPKADHFPRRNRIISGLSLGVLVVEAAEKSGSLITARYALEQGREVFAIPGSIHQVYARGCHRLIQQGASLVQEVEDILCELDSLLAWSRQQADKQSESRTQTPSCSHFPTFLSPNDKEATKVSKDELPFPELLANVGNEATPVDILASRTHIPVQDVMMQLLELELLGHVVAVSGGYILKGRG